MQSGVRVRPRCAALMPPPADLSRGKRHQGTSTVTAWWRSNLMPWPSAGELVMPYQSCAGGSGASRRRVDKSLSQIRDRPLSDAGRESHDQRCQGALSSRPVRRQGISPDKDDPSAVPFRDEGERVPVGVILGSPDRPTGGRELEIRWPVIHRHLQLRRPILASLMSHGPVSGTDTTADVALKRGDLDWIGCPLGMAAEVCDRCSVQHRWRSHRWLTRSPGFVPPRGRISHSRQEIPIDSVGYPAPPSAQTRARTEHRTPIIQARRSDRD